MFTSRLLLRIHPPIASLASGGGGVKCSRKLLAFRLWERRLDGNSLEEKKPVSKKKWGGKDLVGKRPRVERTGRENTGVEKTGGECTGHVEISWRKATLKHVIYTKTCLTGSFSKYVELSTKITIYIE